MRSFLNYLFCLIITLVIGPAWAMARTHQLPEPPPAELWYVTLEIDLDSLLEQKKTNNYFPAKFSFKDAEGEMVSWDIKVRSRGRFRRMKCEFPPLMLKFPKKKMKAAGFGKHNDVKLVTHCAENKQARENLFREFLAYQLYAQLTPVRLDTRLLQITYRDTGSGSEMVTYGIFIEDVDALADRFDTKKCEDCYGLTADQFDKSYLQIHDLFQYMISNSDFSVQTIRNLKILAPKKKEGKYLIAPYDFDFSGLVNANYARPNVDYQQRNVRQRIYLGTNWPAEEWANTLSHFKEKQTDLLAVIENFELLSRKGRRDIRKFLQAFYDELESGYVPFNQHF